MALWRNRSASDSRSEGCVFNSRRGHLIAMTYLSWFYITMRNRNVKMVISEREALSRFRSVMVITCASHAQGSRFNSERNQFKMWLQVDY